MARKGLTGQLNMFDFFREWEAVSPQAGEIEMVSLMPGDEPEDEAGGVEEAFEPDGVFEPVEEVLKPEIEVKQVEEVLKPEIEVKQVEEVSEPELVSEPIEEVDRPEEETRTGERPVMQRIYATQQGAIEIAYINYSKVRIIEPGKSPQIKEFETSKEAVDFYVEQMQRYEELYGTDCE